MVVVGGRGLCHFSLLLVCFVLKGADVLGHLPKQKDKGSGGNDLGAKDGSDDEGEDEEHCKGGVGSDGVGGKDTIIGVNPWGFKGLAVQMRVY